MNGQDKAKEDQTAEGPIALGQRIWSHEERMPMVKHVIESQGDKVIEGHDGFKN